MQRYFISADGSYLGSYDGPDEDMPEQFKGETVVESPPEDGRQKYINGQWGALIMFLPIEPTPFWLAALDLLQLKKTDVLNAITDEDDRYAAGLEIEGRKTYRRDDPMVIKLAELKGYPPEQMDSLWVYVQEHYK